MLWSRKLKHNSRAVTRSSPGATPQASSHATCSISGECSAFLSGSYRGLLVADRRPVPAWAWLNSLAHGDEEVVASLARIPTWDSSADACIARLARRTLLKMRDEHLDLRDVQRAVLIPLELAVAARVGCATPEEVTLSQASSRELVRGLSPISLHAEPGR